jgi:hypothetical protein
MKDLITLDLKRQIVEKLINGDSPNEVSKYLNLSINQVLSVLGDVEISGKVADLFALQARGLGLVALHNISRIAFDTTASPATQLKASKILADIARELQELHPNDLEPAYMSQKSLTDRLSLLQKEAIKRSIPINADVIDNEAPISIDDML